MKLGARTFKTGLAVFLALIISQLLEFEPAIVAAVAAVLTIQPSVYKSWRHLFEQVQGNIIGAVLALLALVYIGNSAVVISVVVMLSIVINLKLGYEKTISLVIFTIIAIMQGSEGHEFTYALNRLTLVMIGIGSSLFINILFLPPKYEVKLLNKIKEANEKCFTYLRLLENKEVLEKTLKSDKKIIEKKIKETSALYELYKDEFEGKFFKTKYTKARKLVVYKQLVKSLRIYESIIDVLERHFYTTEIPMDLIAEYQEHLFEIASYNEKILMKLDKKIDAGIQLDKEKNLYETNKVLLRKTIALDVEKVYEEDNTYHVFSLVTRLTEFLYELNHLDKLINS